MIQITPQTPKGLRIHIGLFGLRNAGKSSLMNQLTGQSVSIVSSTPGTTTDPVEKAYELQPVGPVVFIDTAGFDDVGALGAQRVKRSMDYLEWVDVAVFVSGSDRLNHDDERLVRYALQKSTPVMIVLNKSDQFSDNDARVASLNELKDLAVVCDAKSGKGVSDVRAKLVNIIQSRTEPDLPLVSDLAGEGDTVVLVTPIDTGAPKGRLIMPQVQAIRELLDARAKCFVVQEDKLADALEELRKPPKFIMCDSQVVEKVAAAAPAEIPLTTFSIQMAYSKSDIVELARSTAQLAFLRDGDKVLIAETCSHHPQKDDIGRVKIPRLLRKICSPNLQIDFAAGKDIPLNLSEYKLIIQCGGCIVTRRHMLSRLWGASNQGVPMTNYGMAICYAQGVIERVLACHPAALAAYRTKLLELQQ